MELYTEAETLEGIYRCDRCSTPGSTISKPRGKKGKPIEIKYRDAVKRLKISRPGPIMRFHIKRFIWTGIKREKIHTHLVFPFVLDLKTVKGWGGGKDDADSETPRKKSKTGTTTSSSSRDDLNSHLLDLTGVICHEGKGMSGGHYFSYCKNMSDEWHLYNDHRVSRVTAEEVQAAQAYMLFYSRRGSSVDLQAEVKEDETPKKHRTE
jgi:ubiquitin C-terminal hydrolase